MNTKQTNTNTAHVTLTEEERTALRAYCLERVLTRYPAVNPDLAADMAADMAADLELDMLAADLELDLAAAMRAVSQAEDLAATMLARYVQEA